MKSKKFVALLMAASVLATTAVGCSNGSQSSQSSPGGSGATGAQYKEEIIIAMADEFTTIDIPFMGKVGGFHIIVIMCFSFNIFYKIISNEDVFIYIFIVCPIIVIDGFVCMLSS